MGFQDAGDEKGVCGMNCTPEAEGGLDPGDRLIRWVVDK